MRDFELYQAVLGLLLCAQSIPKGGDLAYVIARIASAASKVLLTWNVAEKAMGSATRRRANAVTIGHVVFPTDHGRTRRESGRFHNNCFMASSPCS